MTAIWVVEGRINGAWKLVKTVASLAEAKQYRLACGTSYDAIRIVKYQRVEEAA